MAELPAYVIVKDKYEVARERLPQLNLALVQRWPEARANHLDGLRLDATFAMVDESVRHILRELAESLHTKKRAEIPITVIAEDHRNLAAAERRECRWRGVSQIVALVEDSAFRHSR